jgi:TolB-like protein
VSEIVLGKLKLIPFRQLYDDNAIIPLRRTPLALLSVLAEAGGAVVTKDELIERIWAGNSIEDNAIQAQVAGLRRALGKHARLIMTVHGLGYRLSLPANTQSETELPSLAVLPFANLSSDPDQSYFVDGLLDEIVTSLSRIRTLIVIASGSTLSLKGQNLSPTEAAEKLDVRYVLEGSVRRAGEDIRISVRLVDASNGTQIWADGFNGSYADFFELQDRVALAVAGIIEFSVQNAEARRTIRRPTKDLQSYELYLRALSLFRNYEQHDMFAALDLLEQALVIDPKFALVLSQASACHALILQFRWSNDPDAHGRAMMELVERSLQHGGDDPQVLATAALSYWATGDLSGAARLAKRGTDLNPGSSFPWLARGKVAIAQGDIELADECMQKSMRLDPISPNRNLQVGVLAAICFAQRHFDEGLVYAHEYVELNHQPLSLGMLAATLEQLGEHEAAAKALAELRSRSPISLPELAAMIYRDETLQQNYVVSLQRIGGG